MADACAGNAEIDDGQPQGEMNVDQAEMDAEIAELVEAFRVVEPDISAEEALRHIKLQRIIASKTSLNVTTQQLSVPVGVKEPDYFTLARSPGQILSLFCATSWSPAICRKASGVCMAQLTCLPRQLGRWAPR